MEVKLKWGHDAVAFDLPDRNVIGVLEPEGGEPVADLWEATWDLLETPTAGEPFADDICLVAVEITTKAESADESPSAGHK